MRVISSHLLCIFPFWPSCRDEVSGGNLPVEFAVFVPCALPCMGVSFCRRAEFGHCCPVSHLDVSGVNSGPSALRCMRVCLPGAAAGL